MKRKISERIVRVLPVAGVVPDVRVAAVVNVVMVPDRLVLPDLYLFNFTKVSSKSPKHQIVMIAAIDNI
jgi:hypothetical protein